MKIERHSLARGVAALALLVCGSAWAVDGQFYNIECTGGPDAAATYVYKIDSYKRSVQMAKIVGKEVIKDPIFLLDGKPGSAVKYIDDKLMLVYSDDDARTFTIVLPVAGGKGNMKIGNTENEKEHRDGYTLTCARK
jgi:hypothetical protein